MVEVAPVLIRGVHKFGWIDNSRECRQRRTQLALPFFGFSHTLPLSRIYRFIRVQPSHPHSTIPEGYLVVLKYVLVIVNGLRG